MLELRVFMAPWSRLRFLLDASAKPSCRDLRAGKQSDPEEGSSEG